MELRSQSRLSTSGKKKELISRYSACTTAKPDILNKKHCTLKVLVVTRTIQTLNALSDKQSDEA